MDELSVRASFAIVAPAGRSRDGSLRELFCDSLASEPGRQPAAASLPRHLPDAPRLEFLPLSEADLSLLATWRARPHVADWFGPPDTIDELREEFLTNADAPPLVRGFLAIEGDRPIGFIQSYVAFEAGDGWWPDERDPGARGIDQFLAEESALGRGLGSAMVRQFVDRLFADAAVSKVQTDPAPDNARAIRCYEKAGFERLGMVTTPDGPSLLMLCTRARFEARGGGKRAS